MVPGYAESVISIFVLTFTVAGELQERLTQSLLGKTTA
jgi:hypothetical protein